MASPAPDDTDVPHLKTPGRRLVALLVCRLYAVLPCVVTPLLAGLQVVMPHGVVWAAVLVFISLIAMATRFPDFLERKRVIVLNAFFYFGVLSLPAALIPFRGIAGFSAGVALGAILSAAVIALTPLLPRWIVRVLQLELFPDILTGLFLSVVFFVPVRLLRPFRYANLGARPPYDVGIIVCAYEEEATIDRSLTSVREAVSRLATLPAVRSARVILVDSSPDDATRRGFASRVDRVIQGHSGKLSARHQAILAETVDIVVAADADRAYEPDWLVKLLAPFVEDSVVASMGETRNWGAGMSASALCRACLKLPFNGGNSAFLRAAYLASPFTITIDQRRHKELWLEEEFLFGLTLQAQGRVVHLPDCRSYELRPYSLLAQLSRHLFGVKLRTF